jgi:phosphoribosylformylglycinamidine synthase
MGGSSVLQVQGQIGEEPPDVLSAAELRAFFETMQALARQQLVLAYHDRSDGGVIVTLLEMAFASRSGLDIELGPLGPDALSAAFSEELGGVLQVRAQDLERVREAFERAGLGETLHEIATPRSDALARVTHRGEPVCERSLHALRAVWSELTHAMQRLRDDASCADEEHAARTAEDDPGISPMLGFDLARLSTERATAIKSRKSRPRAAILREQGVNGQIEMAAALTRAGFDCYDVHMSDIIAGRVALEGFAGLIACGGFSYGDVLGAGEGWAKSILFNARAREELSSFFARPDSFALGVCNGCQMLSNLHELIPGAEHFPRFVQNRSERYEARLLSVEVQESPSVLLRGMAGSRVPVVVAHGEGRLELREAAGLSSLEQSGLVSLRYVDNHGAITERFPWNPSGSPRGITGLCSRDGRVTLMMPHPERVFRTVQLSHHPREWGEDSPWMALFDNAYRFAQ